MCHKTCTILSVRIRARACARANARFFIVVSSGVFSFVVDVLVRARAPLLALLLLLLLKSLFFFRVFLCKNRAKKGHTFAALCVSPCARPSARWRRRRPSSHPRGLFRRRCRLDSRGAGWKMERHRFCADVNVRDLRRQSRVRRRRHRVVVRGGRRSRRRKKARKRRDNERATREKMRRRTRAKAVAGRGP